MAEEQLAKLQATVVRNTRVPGHPVVEIKIFSQDIAAADLKELLAFKEVKRLEFNTAKIDTAGLGALAALPVEAIFLPSNTMFDDAGLKELVKFNDLKSLSVPQGKFTDDAVKGLAALVNLEDI
jgi:hypothetical protein